MVYIHTQAHTMSKLELYVATWMNPCKKQILNIKKEITEWYV